MPPAPPFIPAALLMTESPAARDGLLAFVQALICCDGCNCVTLHCPTCGMDHTLELQSPVDAAELPVQLDSVLCDECNTQIELIVIGWRRNPTGERPAVESLSDALPGLERALAGS